jgi:hypothetical protein
MNIIIIMYDGWICFYTQKMATTYYNLGQVRFLIESNPLLAPLPPPQQHFRFIQYKLVLHPNPHHHSVLTCSD